MTDTTPVLTARLCYALDPTFRELVDSWVRGRRCPLPLVDQCLELGLEAAAECARWAATEPERPTANFTTAGEVEVSYPYPSTQKGHHLWYRVMSDEITDFSRDVPHHRTPHHCKHEHAADVLSAILWLSDNWIPE